MPKLTELNYVSDVVKYDIQDYSRKDIIIAAGAGKLACGTVLGRKSADRKYVPLTLTKTVVDGENTSSAANDDGSQIACAVLISDIDATAADVEAVAVARHATVVKNKLIFPQDISDDDLTKALDELEACGIVNREGA